ncbi:hypothetical protein, partial [Amycolatopsis magusensis]|uniref:hypothetical protein n=1 Tax=Amycolatopsis magusensis TaxID=882444 RepID=UPI0024A9F3E7
MEAIRRAKRPIDGFNIIILFAFASAVMGDVAGALVSQPFLTFGLALLSFAIYFTLLAVTMLLFRRIGNAHALA